jgi:hypothetical protein
MRKRGSIERQRRAILEPIPGDCLELPATAAIS